MKELRAELVAEFAKLDSPYPNLSMDKTSIEKEETKEEAKEESKTEEKKEIE